jgi:hypothetical protein
MATANQYIVSNKELLDLLIRETKVEEGRWMLMASFNITPANVGPTQEQSAPGLAISINHVGIQRAQPDTPAEITADAAVVNPRAEKRRKA